MTYLRTIACDTGRGPGGEVGCLALYLGQPQDGPLAVRTRAQRAGWTIGTDETEPAACPSCTAMRSGDPSAGIVLERGECRTCCGRTRCTPEGDRCFFCGTVVPAPADEDEHQDRGADGGAQH